MTRVVQTSSAMEAPRRPATQASERITSDADSRSVIQRTSNDAETAEFFVRKEYAMSITRAAGAAVYAVNGTPGGRCHRRTEYRV